jgi:hypothetical protein
MISRGNLAVLLLLIISPVNSATPVFELEILDHLFHPEELRIPANTKVKLIVYNRDSTPEEFESYELNREKVIMGGRKANIFIGPLAPGVYPFFGEFNPRTAQGRVVAE